tara:strand:- start:509 stop:1330 length:822 start_codon:yes stop_codon:yes gene_type:complete
MGNSAETGGLVATDLVNDSSPQLGGNLNCQTFNIEIGDSSGIGSGRLKFGNGDLQIYHNGADSYIDEVGEGDLKIISSSGIQLQKNASEKYLACIPDGSTELYFNGVKQVETSSVGMVLGDGKSIGFGDSSDLKLYHTGNHSYIQDSGTGKLRILSNSFRLMNAADSENMIAADENGAVELYYDGSKKIETYSSGVYITGHCQPNGNNVYDLGSTTYRWRNIYTNDLNLSNEGGKNDVDGTWGSYTIQEGAEDLFLINKRTGKKYKFNLTEVS